MESEEATKRNVIASLLYNSKSVFDRVLNLCKVYPDFLTFKNDVLNVKTIIESIKSAEKQSTSPENINRCYNSITRTLVTEYLSIKQQLIEAKSFDETTLTTVTSQSYFLDISEFPGLILKLFWFKSLLEVILLNYASN